MKFFNELEGEARAERNETRMTSLRSLLVQSMNEFITESTGDEDPNEEDRDAAEEHRELLFKEITKDFGEPPEKPDEIEESAFPQLINWTQKSVSLNPVWINSVIEMLRLCKNSSQMQRIRHSGMK